MPPSAVFYYLFKSKRCCCEVEKRRHLLRFSHFLPFCMKHCGNDYDLQKFYNEEDEK